MNLAQHPGVIVVTAPWRDASYTVLGYDCGPGDEITIVRGDICKIVTGQERAAAAVCRWLAGSAREAPADPGRTDDSGG